ncbi:MAG: polysaccharide biosynthesis/export family protein [Acidobacteriota bacterium]|nr:polysaccharide biosynthesis/export family protein [Acidobacteriota bacterium]
MKILSCIIALLTCTLSAVSVSAQDVKTQALAQATTKNDNPPATPRNYTLVPGDEIEISVWNEPQFNGKYTIDENGKFVLPFVNKTIQAGCRTQAQVTEDVTAALTKYLKNPSPYLNVVKKNIAPAVIYGEVRVPQKVEMQRRVRLLELLSFSGGWTPSAGGTVQIFRTQPIQCPEPGEELEPQPLQDGSNVPFRVYKLSEISSGKEEANPIIRPGDVVDVKKAPPVFIIGEVRNPPPPDALTIPEDGLMLTDAIARSGGLTREAKKKDVKIYRLKAGSKERETLSANLQLIKDKKQPDIVLQPYDVIEVEKAPKSIKDYLRESLTLVSNGISGSLPYRILY